MNILFDTCEDEIKLLKSLNDNNLDIKKMDYIIISHVHGDHAGGLMGLKKTDLSPKTKILINEKVYNRILEAFPARGLKLAELNVIKTRGDFKIAPDLIYTDAIVGKDGKLDIFESFIVIKKRKGLIVIAACSHPEIKVMCEYAKKITKCNKILALIGGLGCIDNNLGHYLKRTNASVYPVHCSWFKDDGEKLIKAKALPFCI